AALAGKDQARDGDGSRREENGRAGEPVGEDVGAGDDLDEVALRARSADLLLEERGEPFRLREEAALDPLEPRAALVQAEPGPCGLGTARAVHQTRDLVERRDGYGRKGRTVPRAHAADRAVDHR